MATHDLKEAFALGTRLIAFDRPRLDPQAPGRFGAIITYDLDLKRHCPSLCSASRSHSTSALTRAKPKEPKHEFRVDRRAPAPGRASSGPACLRRHHPDFYRPARRKAGKRSKPRDGCPEAGGARSSNGRSTWACPGADCLTDRSIPTFARGELPHFAGINTFLKAPYVEDVHDVGRYDAAVLGVPFDIGTTYRPGTRFGPQACGGSRRSTRPTITSSASTCASR